MKSPAVLAVALLAACSTPTEPDRSAKAPALDGFGRATLHAGHGSAARLFEQGMQQAYAFNHAEAIRAFKAALAADPACALCAWGVAWQLGPNINAPERSNMAEARRYAALAQRLAGSAPGFDQALVDAMALRYLGAVDVLRDGPPEGEICGRAGSGSPHPLDIAYAQRLRGVADALPRHPDVVALYAEAELIATADAWWDAGTGRPGGRVAEVADRIERALQATPDHTGLNHYMVHVMDASPNPARAEPAADRLGALAPASPHLLHMPSHVYVHLGRYGDAARVNEEALAAQLTLDAAIKAQDQKPLDDWNGHNLHFLWYSALMQGRGDLALATARHRAERAAKGTSGYAEYSRALPVLTLARLQRWDDVLREPLDSGSNGVGAAIGRAAQGLALLRTGQTAAARERLLAVQAAAGSIDADFRPLLAPLAGWLQAELALADGRTDAARAAYAQAALAEDSVGGEPPVLATGSRVALGDAMLRARAWADAEAAYRDDLRRNPGNGWALRGLVASLDAQSRSADAAQARRELAAAWSQADTALR